MGDTRLDYYRLALLMVGGASGAVASVVLGHDVTWQLWLLVPFIVLLGLPHGCLDLAIAQKLRPLPTTLSLAGFVAVYLGLAGLVLGLWLWLPGIALALFLGYSALHFAGDWRRYLPGLRTLPLGLTIVAIPAVAYQQETASILAMLAPAEWAQGLAQAMTLIALMMGSLALCLLVAGWVAKRVPHIVVVEFIALVIIALVTPPLVYFALYFCVAHSPKHLQDSREELGLTWRGLCLRALPIWLVTILGALIAFAIIPAAPLAPQAATLQIIFIGLAALTIPHMLLVEAMWRLPGHSHGNHRRHTAS